MPRFFEGRLPDLNLGTADGSSCSPPIEAAAWSVLANAVGFTAIRNGRFKGGAITRRYGQPAHHIHALQLEIAQACYMDEEPPFPWRGARAARLTEVLRALVGTIRIC